MKKLVFAFVAFAAISFASCGNKAANKVESAEPVAAEEAACTHNHDHANCDSTATCTHNHDHNHDHAHCDSTKVAE